MRYFALFLMAVSLCVFAVGCPETKKPAPPATPPVVDTQEDETTPEAEVEAEVEAEKAPEEGSGE